MKKGDLLISFGVDAMKAAGYPCTASMIACSIDGCQRVKPIAEGTIRSGTAVLEVKGYTGFRKTRAGKAAAGGETLPPLFLVSRQPVSTTAVPPRRG